MSAVRFMFQISDPDLLDEYWADQREVLLHQAGWTSVGDPVRIDDVPGMDPPVGAFDHIYVVEGTS